jgi:NitT/TauT family transport system permease protein
MPAAVSVLRRHAETPLTLLALLALWQLAVMVLDVPEYVLPSPVSIFEHLALPQPDANYNWSRHIGATVTEVLIAFVVTAVVGFVIAVILTWSRTVRELTMPALIFLNSLPIIALAPIIVLWFGYGLGTNVLIGFLVAFFPLVINVSQGLSRVEEDLLDLVRYMNASKWQVFVKIRFPKSLPYLFSGLKICSTMVVVGAIVGEFIASDRGLGYIIINSQYTMNTPPIFAALFVVSAIGVGLFGLVSLAERLLMPWIRPAEDSVRGR